MYTSKTLPTTCIYTNGERRKDANDVAAYLLFRAYSCNYRQWFPTKADKNYYEQHILVIPSIGYRCKILFDRNYIKDHFRFHICLWLRDRSDLIPPVCKYILDEIFIDQQSYITWVEATTYSVRNSKLAGVDRYIKHLPMLKDDMYEAMQLYKPSTPYTLVI